MLLKKQFLSLVENIARKGEKAGNQHFLLVSGCFLKPTFHCIKCGLLEFHLYGVVNNDLWCKIMKKEQTYP